MGVVLRDRENARETAELAGLLVAVDHGGLGVALGHFAIAVWFAVEDLCVVRAVHRLHCVLATFARGDFEKFVGEFLPVTALFIQLLFGDVGDRDAFVSPGCAHFPDECIKFFANDGTARSPQRQTGSNEL